MKKLLLGFLSLAFVSCLATAVSFKSTIATAQEATNINIFTETKCQISKNGDKMLMVTGITDVSNIYEIGYDISGGYVVNENDKAVTNKYYESLTLGTETKLAGDFIPGAEGLLIWEIAYDSSYTYSVQPYAYVGTINDEGQLVAPDENEKTLGAIKANFNTLAVTYEEAEGVTFNGESTVNRLGDYTFSIDVADGYAAVVYCNGTKLTANENGTYTVEGVKQALNITFETYEQFGVISGEGAVEKDVYQAHAEAGLDGVTGTKLTATDTAATFNYLSNVNLVAGENVVAKFMTTNDIMPTGEGKYEVNYVTFHLADTVTGNTLSVSIRSYDFVDGVKTPSAYVALFFNGGFIGIVSDDYYSNFSNETRGSDWAFLMIPEIKLNTTTGALSYCNKTIATLDYLIGFGVTNELSASVELNLKEAGNGVVIETLCNEKMSKLAKVVKDESEAYTITGANSVKIGGTYTFNVAVNEALYEGDYTVLVNGEALVATDGVYTVANVQEDLFITVEGLVKKQFSVASGNGTVEKDAYQAHAEAGLDGVTGTKLIATDTTATFNYLSNVNLIAGENLIAKFMTTNDIMPAGQGKYEVNYVTFHLTDTVTGNTISISVRSYPFVEGAAVDAPNAWVAIFYNGGFLDLKMDNYGSNFSNVTKNDTAWRYIPQVYLDTVSGSISYCGANIYTNGAFVGFGVTNEISVSVELNLKEAGNGVVIETLCNEKLSHVAKVVKATSEAYTITGADRVKIGGTYTFNVAVNEALYEGDYTVLVNGEAVVATDGVYTVANVQEDLFITVEGLVKKISFSVTSGNGTVEKNASQAHAEAGLDGVTGTKLTSTDTTSVFTYDSTMNLIAGENVLAKFMTTNEIMVNKGNFEVDGVKFNFTDGNGNTLTIWIRSYAYTEGGSAYDAEISNPQASVTIFYNGALLAVTYPAGYLDNFSNVTRDTGWAFLMIPEIGLNTTTGTISYCGAVIGTYDYLVGFGVTSELTVSVQLDLHVTGYGIVIDTLCNEKLASVAVAKE